MLTSIVLMRMIVLACIGRDDDVEDADEEDVDDASVIGDALIIMMRHL